MYSLSVADVLPTVPIKQAIRAKHIIYPITMLTTAAHRSAIPETQKGITVNYNFAFYSGVFAHAKPDACNAEVPVPSVAIFFSSGI